MDTDYNLYSFRYGQYNHILHIGKHDFDALDLQEKHFILPFSRYIMFTGEMRQTWILTITPFCSLWHYNHVLSIGMHDIDALDLQKKLFFPPFFL